MDLVLSDIPPNFIRTFAVAFGLVWGSFLNVVIYRVPRGLSVVRPASHCPGCGKPVRHWDNVPVLGWLWLRGKARCCKAKLSIRYPLVELIGGVLSLAIVEMIIFRMAPDSALSHALAVYGANLALALGLVAAAFIDLEHMFLPDTITIGGTLLGLATFSFRSMSFSEAIVGAIVGFLVVWIPFDLVYSKLLGRVGMALGDAKLLMLAGAWFGWESALFVLGAGAVQGTIVALAVLVVRGKIEEPAAVRAEREEARAALETLGPEERARVEKELELDPVMHEPGEGVGQARIAFGPFLMLAILECLLVGRESIGRVIGWIE